MTEKQTTRTEGQQLTAVWRNGGCSASYDSFVVKIRHTEFISIKKISAH